MFFSTICFSDIFCSKVAKWPNLSNLKNRENDSGSIPPFALPSDARRKKGKQAVLRPRRAAWPSILLEHACCVHQRDISWLVACHLCFWWNVLAHHDYVGIKGLHLATGLYYFKAYMSCDLLLSHCSGNEGRAGQLTWISENSEKSVCCRFNGFLLWIVGSLVKQMPKDSWIVSYENCRSACKMVLPQRYFNVLILPTLSFSMKQTVSHGPWNPNFEVGWVCNWGEHQRPATSQRLFANMMRIECYSAIMRILYEIYWFCHGFWKEVLLALLSWLFKLPKMPGAYLSSSRMLMLADVVNERCFSSIATSDSQTWTGIQAARSMKRKTFQYKYYLHWCTR